MPLVTVPHHHASSSTPTGLSACLPACLQLLSYRVDAVPCFVLLMPCARELVAVAKTQKPTDREYMEAALHRMLGIAAGDHQLQAVGRTSLAAGPAATPIGIANAKEGMLKEAAEACTASSWQGLEGLTDLAELCNTGCINEKKYVPRGR